VSLGEVVTSLAAFTLLYGLLAVVEVKLILTFARRGLPDVTPPPERRSDDHDRPLEFAY